MIKKYSLLYICMCVLSLFIFKNAIAQSNEDEKVIGPSQPSKIELMKVPAIVFDGDTMPVWYLNEVQIIEKYLNKDRSNEMLKLRYNVTKVYPYAVEAARIISAMDIELKKAKNNREKRLYIKTMESALNAKFKEPLKNLSTKQGLILVKLINRQSGKDVYSVIKELKGGLAARFSQTAFYFFDNNLKKQYDPYGEDKDIESIVQDLEGRAYYNYQIQNTPILKFQDRK
ncbi:MAG TPA: DUF4294 domain-containing protein [Edaphocola sp.]|nr:DUF4294 domain-containing protein [Edaphocola sp.]